jgi:ATP-dependent RNA helicase DDX19/DBP5
MDSKHEESKDPAPSAEGQGENDELPANKFLELNEDDSGDEGNEIEKADLTYIKSEKTWEEVILSHPNKATMINQLVKLGFRKPSKIQQRSVPFIMANTRIGMSLQSQNGSGKTLAFVIPAILRVNTQLKLQK